MILALDAMGGDRAPDINVEGAILAVKQTDNDIILVGKEDVIHAQLEKWSKKYTFNEQGQLVKIKGGDEESRFSDFDEYGNWKLWKCTEDHAIGRFTTIIERTFEYYK